MAYTDVLADAPILDQAPSASVPATDDERLLRAFVGENGDLYVTTLNKMLAKDPTLRTIVYEWNWSAFFGMVVWTMYRKMWALLAAMWFGLGLAEQVAFGHSVPLINLLVGILAASASKSLYVRSAMRRIRKLQARGLTEEELLAQIEDKGRSRVGLIVGFVLAIVGTFAAFAQLHH